MRRIAFTFGLLCFVAVAVGGVNLGALLPFGKNRSGVNAAQQSDSERMQELRQLINEEIGEPIAKAPAQCKLIAFGSKPCGGPATYLVYSLAKTDESRLKKLVSEFNERQKNYNREKKILSDCMFVTEPKMELTDGVCKIEWNSPRPVR